ncbi:MAG: hypothetical protein JW772_01605 [Candidatus Diapherotrites archaeon]|nr:hypothetical protein [Candidatus Diapherotrites archaeon]
MVFNRRGQAFDVFKLLIAAVVAVVILTLLLSIVGQIDIFGQGDPLKEGQTVLRDIVTKRTTPQNTKKVTFTPNYSINSSSLSEGTDGQVDEDAICVSAGDFIDDSSWTENNGRRVTYTGTGNKTVVLRGICDICSKIAEDYDQYFDDYDPEFLFDEGSVEDSCGSLDPFNSENNDEICCVVAVKKTT